MNASRLSAHWFPSDRWRVRCDHDHKYDNKEQKLEFPSCGDNIKPENFNPSEAEETHKHVMWSFLVTKLDNKRIEDLSLSLCWCEWTVTGRLLRQHKGPSCVGSIMAASPSSTRSSCIAGGFSPPLPSFLSHSVCCTVMMRLDEVFVLKSDTVCGTEA